MKALFQQRRYFLIFLFIELLTLSGCDSLFIKRIDIQKNSELNNSFDKRSIIISVVDDFTTENNFSCKPSKDIIRDCNKIPVSLVVFEDNNSFTICLFKLGILEDDEFYIFGSSIEEALISKMPSAHINSSPPGQLPQCSIPSQ